jgi:hypothetical protein
VLIVLALNGVDVIVFSADVIVDFVDGVAVDLNIEIVVVVVMLRLCCANNSIID